ncbi:hypothetical protein R3P38DRAFT_3295539 [Favolaschia claudopus]|uniref:Uncharacterized protein n=1 Tax=Favolaschia claudopus TaxID=2862362 RepID=A0AAV9ZB19_9AGAR
MDEDGAGDASAADCVLQDGSPRFGASDRQLVDQRPPPLTPGSSLAAYVLFRSMEFLSIPPPAPIGASRPLDTAESNASNEKSQPLPWLATSYKNSRRIMGTVTKKTTQMAPTAMNTPTESLYRSVHLSTHSFHFRRLRTRHGRRQIRTALVPWNFSFSPSRSCILHLLLSPRAMAASPQPLHHASSRTRVSRASRHALARDAVRFIPYPCLGNPSFYAARHAVPAASITASSTLFLYAALLTSSRSSIPT